MAEATAAGPVLVHFFDFAQLNAARTLPYLRAWHRRYAPIGLSVLGAHSPRFAFTGERATLAAGLASLELPYSVADDSGYGLWHDYGCRGWPSLFLWAQGGTLRWVHFGEGEYRATEEAIQEELAALDPLRELPQPLPPVRQTDAPGALVSPPTPESFPGGSPARPWAPVAGDEPLSLDYAAGGAFATLDGDGELEVAIDGAKRTLGVDAPGLRELASHPRHESHHLALRPSPGVRVWSVSFAAGLP